MHTFRARWVLPVDGPPIDGGCVSIAGGRIATIGEPGNSSGPVEDLGDVVLAPGLVNAHTHLEFSDLPAPLGAPGMRLPDWIRLVIAERNRRGRDAAASIAAGLGESLAAGATTVGEIAAQPAACYRSDAAGPATLLFHEAIGFSERRVESALADVVARLGDGASAGLSPHATYTVHPALLSAIVAVAVRREAPVAMHVAESREELELLAEGRGPFRELLEDRSMWDAGAIPRGSRPLDYLRALAEAPRSIVIHGNYLAADEIEFIASHRQRMSVVYCPRTHTYFRHAPHPLAALRQAGVCVALGTDSRASNPDLSMLAELRALVAARPELAPAEAVRMATVDGAAALGLVGEAGSLAAGKRADFVAISMPRGGSSDDPYAIVAQSGEPPAGVWLGGVRIVLPTSS